MNDKTSPSLVRDVTWHAVLTRVKVKFESLPDKSCVDLSEVKLPIERNYGPDFEFIKEQSLSHIIDSLGFDLDI